MVNARTPIAQECCEPALLADRLLDLELGIADVVRHLKDPTAFLGTDPGRLHTEVDAQECHHCFEVVDHI